MSGELAAHESFWSYPSHIAAAMSKLAYPLHAQQAPDLVHFGDADLRGQRSRHITNMKQSDRAGHKAGFDHY